MTKTFFINNTLYSRFDFFLVIFLKLAIQENNLIKGLLIQNVFIIKDFI